MTPTQATREAMENIKAGRIRHHVISCNSRDHSGEPELIEAQNFRDFLPSKTACMIFNLTGNDNLR